MAATLHKLSSTDGYEYYVKQVAAHDATQHGHTSLAAYYSSKGESPGVWLGSGLVAFAADADGAIKSGDPVSQEQMGALFGEGRHPNATRIEARIIAEQIALGAKPKDARRHALKQTRLGRAMPVYEDGSDFRRRCAEAFTAHNLALGLHWKTPVPDEDRARIRTDIATAMFTAELGRPPLDERELSGWIARASRPKKTAVPGYDITFSPVKSVSTLWAIAPKSMADTIEAAHHAAVADALAYLEQHAAYTRLGRAGVRQVDVEGLIATAFTHRDSRAGDPDLHTHMVISNRVRTTDGKHWQALDGRLIYRTMVTASEVYNTRLEQHVVAALGVEFEDRPDTDPTKRPIREIVGVDPALNQRWSSRAEAITKQLGKLAARFQATHGREPGAIEMFSLAQEATLATRGSKHEPRSRAEQRASWRAEALQVLGGVQALIAMVYAACHPKRSPPPVIDAPWIARTAHEVIDTISHQRAVWQATHVRSESERRIRSRVPVALWQQTADAVVAAALSHAQSITLREPDRLTPPVALTRRDGSSVYTVAESQQYTSTTIVAAESRLVEASRARGARTVSGSVLAQALAAYANAHPDRQLNPGQVALIRDVATSDAQFALAIAPAGTGKTTAMEVLTAAWELGGGTVLGLAPTAAAAAVLGEDTGATVATVDKLTHTLDQYTPSLLRLPNDPAHPRPVVPQWLHDIGPNTLIIIDEVAKASTLHLDRAVAFCLGRGARVLGIGDDQQLPSVAAGGVVRDIVHTSGAFSLSRVMRFATPAEGPASLALREGDPAAIGFYVDLGRVHVGAPDTVADAAYTAWFAHHDAGKDAVMLAPTREIVRDLNDRARFDRLAHQPGVPTGPEVELADGLHASAGDIIATRRNNPRLRISPTDHVRNGYRWIVQAVNDDGSIDCVHLRPGGKQGRSVTLPPDYISVDVTLGYATTIDSAQGLTADYCHGVLSGGETRQQLYVMATRGRAGNHLYLTTALDGTEQSLWTERALIPRTAVDILTEILARDGAERSATTRQREMFDPVARLAVVTATYIDAISALAEHHLGQAAMTEIATAAERLHPGLTDAPAWPALRQHLATIAVTGSDPIAALRAAVAERDLADAADPAAVLDWRLDASGRHSAGTGPLPWLRAIPDALRADPDAATFLADLTDRITGLARAVAARASAWTPQTAPHWARPIVELDRPDLLTSLTVWRAATGVEDHDRLPTGPRLLHPARERAHQQQLDQRVHALLGRLNRVAARWTPLADRIDPRIVEDPHWPDLAGLLDAMHRAGLDVRARLTAAARQRPLPDEMPSAALWWRVACEPDVQEAAAADRLRPAWTSTLPAILGPELADRVLVDPAWPGLVQAVEAADPTAWTAPALLTNAHAVLTAHHTDHGSLSPGDITTALAHLVEGISRHTATRHDPLPPEPIDPDTEEELAARASILGAEHPDPTDHLHAAPTARPRPHQPTGDEPDDGYLTALLADEPPPRDHPQHDPDNLADDPADDSEEWLAEVAEHRLVPDRYADLPRDERVQLLVADFQGQLRVVRYLDAAYRDPLAPFTGGGRHTQMADALILDLCRRRDRQRPYWLAARDAHADWLAAEHDAEQARARAEELALRVERHDPHADLAELENLAAAVTDPARREQLARQIADMRARPAVTAGMLDLALHRRVAAAAAERAATAQARAAAAEHALIEFAGPGGVVTQADVDTARLAVDELDLAELIDARNQVALTEGQLFRAAGWSVVDEARWQIVSTPHGQPSGVEATAPEDSRTERPGETADTLTPVAARPDDHGVRTLTTAALAERIDTLRRQITTIALTAAPTDAQSPASAIDQFQTERHRLTAAHQAITRARAAADDEATTDRELNRAREQTRRLREDRAATPAHRRSTRRDVDAAIDNALAAERQLEAALHIAHTATVEATRDAVLLAGPAPGWGELVAAATDPDLHTHGLGHAMALDAARETREAAHRHQVDDHIALLRNQLDAAVAEQQHRSDSHTDQPARGTDRHELGTGPDDGAAPSPTSPSATAADDLQL